jgi:hypothetical protein
MIDKIIKILEKNKIEEILFTGCFDEEDKDFIINKNYLFFETESKYICFEAIEGYSKLKIYLTTSIEYNNQVEDLIDGAVKVGDLVFVNPLSSNRKTSTVTFINLQNEVEYLTCNALYFELINGEFIFLDPSFLGIKIGGKQQKIFWESNLDPEQVCQEVIMKIGDNIL